MLSVILKRRQTESEQKLDVIKKCNKIPESQLHYLLDKWCQPVAASPPLVCVCVRERERVCVRLCECVFTMGKIGNPLTHKGALCVQGKDHSSCKKKMKKNPLRTFFISSKTKRKTIYFRCTIRRNIIKYWICIDIPLNGASKNSYE